MCRKDSRCGLSYKYRLELEKERVSGMPRGILFVGNENSGIGKDKGSIVNVILLSLL